VASPGDSALISVSARLLFANGQTTARTVAAVEQLADGLGFRAAVFPRWGELTVRIDDDTGSRYEIIAVEPVGVDMSKVAATMAGGFVGLVALGQTASPDLLFGVIADGTTAIRIILAMTFGLILPKMGIEHFYSGFITPIREAPGKAAVPGKFKTRRYRWRFR